jgi:NAD+ kinase
VKKIGIIAKPHSAAAKNILKKLVPWLKERKKEVFLDKETSLLIGESSSYSRPDIPKMVDMIIVMGGDGTFLSVARLVNDNDVPLFGVNVGGLGFLTEVTREEFFPTLERIFAGDFIIDERLKLITKVYRKGKKITEYAAVNDIVINKGAMARIIDLEAFVDGKYVTTYKADGLIVSTPTGSTAYSLAAEGPILYPTIRALILNPICPHTLTDRPLVVPDNAKIEITLISKNEDVYLTIDGQVGFDLQYKDRLLVTKSNKSVKMILSPEKNYFEVLRKKLKWGERM